MSDPLEVTNTSQLKRRHDHLSTHCIDASGLCKATSLTSYHFLLNTRFNTTNGLLYLSLSFFSSCMCIQVVSTFQPYHTAIAIVFSAGCVLRCSFTHSANSPFSHVVLSHLFSSFILYAVCTNATFATFIIYNNMNMATYSYIKYYI